MPIKYYKPTTPGRRHASVLDTSTLTQKRPERSLRMIRKKTGGRNNQGKITVRHHGGGAKRFCRIIDFKRDTCDMPGKVISLEYDPNRSAHIALVDYPTSEKKYILAPEGLKVGDTVVSTRGNKAEIHPGNALLLRYIPAGMFVHNVELSPGRGGKIARSAGASCVLQGLENGYAQLKTPSGEIRLVSENCLATVGVIGNAEYRNVRLGKAGRTRHFGIRPTVTGKSMNPVDHPHGGGEGHQPIGLKHPKTPWGKPALGVKTRRRKPSDKMILQRRKNKKRK